jgi:hypothetical protein
MNIDQLKQEWASESGQTAEVTSLADVKKIKTPFDRIKRNILTESVIYLIAGVILLIAVLESRYLLVVTDPNAVVSFTVAVTTMFIGIINILLFLVVAFRFYAYMSRLDLSLPNSLSEFIFKFKLTVELYRSYNYTMMPLALILGLSINSHHIFDHVFQAYAKGSISIVATLISIIGFMVLVILGYWFTNYWVNKFYGKYIDELETINNELN